MTAGGKYTYLVNIAPHRMKWKHGRKVALSDVQSNVINLLTYHQNKFHSIINRAENIYLAIGKYTFTTQMALTRFRLFKHIRGGWYVPPYLNCILSRTSKKNSQNRCYHIESVTTYKSIQTASLTMGYYKNTCTVAMHWRTWVVNQGNK